MRIAYLILLLALLTWKGYRAWQRGRSTWLHDREQCRSLEEYLLGNGATHREALRPFIHHALQRAFTPLLHQWRLWVAVAVLGILVWILSSL